MKISALPILADITGDEDVVMRRGNTTGRGTIGNLVTALVGIMQLVDRPELDASIAALIDGADNDNDSLKKIADRVTAEAARAADVEDVLQVRPDRSTRPGDSLLAFTTSRAGGDPTQLPKIAAELAVVGADGRVVQHVGEQLTVQAIYTKIEPGRSYAARFAVRRLADVAGIAVRVGMFWYDVAYNPLADPHDGTMMADPVDIVTVVDGGRWTQAFTFSTEQGADFLVPAGAAYGLGFVETLEGELGLHVELIDVADVTDLCALAADIGNAHDRIERADLSAAMHADALDDTATDIICGRSVKSWTPALTQGFTGWGLFCKPQADDVSDGFALDLAVPGNVASFDIQVISRPASFTAIDAPGELDEDITHEVRPTVSFAPSATPVVTHDASERVSRLIVKFSRALTMSAARNYAFMARARDADGNLVQIGRVASEGAGLSPFGVGWTFGASGVLTKLPEGADATAGFVFRRTPASPPPSGLTRLIGKPQISGLTVDLGGIMARDLNGLRPLFNGRVNVPPASSGVGYTHHGYNMISHAVGDYLPHTNISNAVVKLAGTSTVLRPEIDYHIDTSGRLYATGHAPALVDVTYDWAMERIDLIAEVPEFSDTILILGQERVHTAHEDMYRGKATNPAQRPLFNVRVVGNQIMETIPVWDWIGTFSILHHNEIDAHIGIAKENLSRSRTTLIRGGGFILAGGPDSNTQCGGGEYVNELSLAPNRFIQDVGATDLIGFDGFYDTAPSEADFKTAYQAAQVGALAPVMMNGQPRYKSGPNWKVVDAIQRTYGHAFIADRIPNAGELTYLNFGIGGTTLADTPGNLGHSARLDRIIDPAQYGFRKPDLFILQAGMNGTPDPDLPDQLDHILGRMLGAGIDVLVYGMHLTNMESPMSPANRFTLHSWRSINAQIRRVALARGAAYMPTDMMQGPGFEGYFGLSAASLCRPTYGVHDGPYIRRKVGEFIARAVL